jgi:membrane protein DedA with SNARE-associated domain
VEWFSADYLKFLISTYGYWAVGLIVCLESMGLPLPGEAVLVIASLYAGRHQDLHIAGVIAAAATGAVLGDNIGYLLGREFGYRLLLRYGGNVGLSHARIKLGQYLFARHGGKVVFLGRFVALLRVMAAFLAGMNRMDWRHFLLANAAGGILWAAVFGLGAHTFGKVLLQASAPLAAGLLLMRFLCAGMKRIWRPRQKGRCPVHCNRFIAISVSRRSRLRSKRRNVAEREL